MIICQFRNLLDFGWVDVEIGATTYAICGDATQTAVGEMEGDHYNPMLLFGPVSTEDELAQALHDLLLPMLLEERL